MPLAPTPGPCGQNSTSPPLSRRGERRTRCCNGQAGRAGAGAIAWEVGNTAAPAFPWLRAALSGELSMRARRRLAVSFCLGSSGEGSPMKRANLMLATLAFLGLAAPSEAGYVLTDLGTFVPQGVNNAWQVVGYSYIPSSFSYNAFLYSNGVLTNLS